VAGRACQRSASYRSDIMSHGLRVWMGVLACFLSGSMASIVMMSHRRIMLMLSRNEHYSKALGHTVFVQIGVDY
jgi:hypothetical protein